MDGSSLGRAIAGGIMGLIVAAFVAGGVVFTGGYFLIAWIARHLSWSWS